MNLKTIKQPILTMALTSRRFLVDHAPIILTTTGAIGMVTTTVLAVSETPKALELLQERGFQEPKEILKDPIEAVKTAGPCYIPAMVTGGVSLACLFGAHKVSAKRYAALMALQTLTQDKLEKYQETIKESLGEKKAEALHEQFMNDLVQDPITHEYIIDTGGGNTLCYDSVSGRYFKSDIEKIRQAQNDINETIILDYCVSLNEFYGHLGLDGISIGEDLGWSVDKLLRISFSSRLTSAGEPVLVMEYDLYPEYRTL